MRKLFYLFVGIVFSFNTSAQLQNLDFEAWDFPVTFNDPAYNRPAGWICTNRWFGFEEVGHSEKMVRPVDSLAQSNEYALSLFTFYNYMKDAAVQTAAIDYRPAALNGFYKYEDNFVIWGLDHYIDTAQVLVLLTKWNPVLLKNEEIGRGRFTTYQATTVFKSFQANIEYASVEQPDSITILLDPSFVGRYLDFDIQNEASGGRSIFTVDNLSLSGESTAGIKELTVNQELMIYPNPATSQIGFGTISGKVTVTDLTGKIVMGTTLVDTDLLDVSQLNKGVFVIQIRNEKGVYSGRFVKL